MGLVEVTPPAVEPLTLQEVKDHLRVDHVNDDSLIEPMIKGARMFAEGATRRALITQTWDWLLDAFPAWTLTVPMPPLQSITSITYIDTDGNSQTLAASEYRVDTSTEPGRITPAFSKVWPVTRAVTGAVTVQFIAGYGLAAQDVPHEIRLAMQEHIGHWYEHRESVMVGTNVVKMPLTAERLLANYHVAGF